MCSISYDCFSVANQTFHAIFGILRKDCLLFLSIHAVSYTWDLALWHVRRNEELYQRIKDLCCTDDYLDMHADFPYCLQLDSYDKI